MGNISRIGDLLADPTADMTLEDLKNHLNELAGFRQNVRVAFCKKLARAYFLIVGSEPMKPGHSGHVGYSTEALAGRKRFFLWCKNNLRSASGKEYKTTSLLTYVGLGFKVAPEKVIAFQLKREQKRAAANRSVAVALVKAIDAPGPKVVAAPTLRKKYALPSNVAAEVNALMRAWDEASTEARKQFLYLVTDRRISA